jgi:hypothetical protein
MRSRPPSVSLKGVFSSEEAAVKGGGSRRRLRLKEASVAGGLSSGWPRFREDAMKTKGFWRLVQLSGV